MGSGAHGRRAAARSWRRLNFPRSGLESPGDPWFPGAMAGHRGLLEATTPAGIPTWGGRVARCSRRRLSTSAAAHRVRLPFQAARCGEQTVWLGSPGVGSEARARGPALSTRSCGVVHKPLVEGRATIAGSTPAPGPIGRWQGAFCSEGFRQPMLCDLCSSFSSETSRPLPAATGCHPRAATFPFLLQGGRCAFPSCSLRPLPLVPLTPFLR